MEKLPIVKVMVQRRYRRLAPTSVLMETEHAPDHVFARRGELKFKLSFTQQNCGFFLDIEPARRWLEENCAGKKVLNLFAYTCAFSVVAMQAGANSVVNIDLSRKSLSVGQANHQLNSVNADGAHFLPHNIFTSWGKLKKLGPYDIVIIDPPTCQKGSFEARGDYPKVLRRMGDLLAEKGTFLACLNAPEIDASSFEKMIGSAVTGYLLNARLPGNPDFPDLKEPSLKMFVYSKQG